MKNKELNYGIQLIRIVACLMILLHHLSVAFGITMIESFGKYAVSLFIVISGYLCGFVKDSSEYKMINFKRIITSVKSKVRRIYPYYFMSFIIGVFFLVLRPDLNRSGYGLLFQSTTFLLMIQGWFPKEGIYFEINAVCWYMSCVLFFALVEPILLKILSRCDRKKKIVMMIVALTILVIITVCFDYYGVENNWLLYICPLVRTLDFLIAMIVGNLMKNFHCSYSTAKGTVIEVCTIMVVAIYAVLPIKNVWQSNVAFLPISVFAIAIFSLQKGWISSIAKHKNVLRFADLTMIIYLFHQEVYSVVHMINKSILHLPAVVISFIAVICAIIAAVIIRWIYEGLSSKIKGRLGHE